jgi:uncharacterized protein (TIGR03083 family)
MADYQRAYSESRERFSDLVSQAADEDLVRKVPACPDWTLKELLAHVIGVAADSVAGNVSDMGADDWTEQQVAGRRDRSIEDLLTEWKETATAIEGTLNTIHPALAGGLIGDLLTHEQDARGSLNKPGARDVETLELPAYTYVRFFGTRVKKAGLDAVEVKADDLSWVAGAGDPGVSVSGSVFEIFRSLTGRRTRDEVRALEWNGDQEPYLEVFSQYNYTGAALHE